MRNWLSVCLGMAVALCGAQSAWAALQLNEILFNVPGGGDDGSEYIEIIGSASESVNNVWIIEIDSNGGTNGAILNAIDLTAAGTVGTNGLLLVRDNATVLSPAPAAATTVFIANFNPDLENNTTTIALVTNFTGSVGTDLDTNDDGTIDVALPWTATLDAVTNQDSGGGDFPHADDLGGTVLPIDAGYTPDVIMRDPATPTVWLRGDALGTFPGPYVFSATEISDPTYAGGTLNPGNLNTTVPVEISGFSTE